MMSLFWQIKEVLFYGQAIAAVLANSHENARTAALLITSI